MKKNYLRIMTAGIMTAGMLTLSACTAVGGDAAGGGATTAQTAEATEAPTEAPNRAPTETPGDGETAPESTGSGGADEGAESQAAQDTLFGSFQSVTLDGEAIDETVFGEAKLTMVNIWGTFCGPCIVEMPFLAEISQEYGGADFQMVGIISDAQEAGYPDAVEIVEATGADYTHIMLSDDLKYGYVGSLYAVPTTVFVDSEGRKVGDTYMGAKSKEQWEEIIKSLME